MKLFRPARRRHTATAGHRIFLLACCVAPISVLLARGVAGQSTSDTAPVYKQRSALIEARIQDLMARMKPEEKVRQLDLYAGAPALVSRHTDDTHAAKDAVFLPEKAEALWGDLGVGGIHDLNPTPEQANTIKRWVIAHNRLGIPALFIVGGLHGFGTGTVFPAPIHLAATFDPVLAQKTGTAIAAEARATGVGMLLAAGRD